MAKATRLSIANYNVLDNIPVIEADITIVEPVANTYYKHTDGVIYFYNGTEFKAITGNDEELAQRVQALEEHTEVVDKHELSAEVQASLDRADSAIQSLDGYATEGYVSGQISTHNTDTTAHADIRTSVENAIKTASEDIATLRTDVESGDNNTLNTAKGYTEQQVGLHNESANAHNDIRETIKTVEAIAKGRATGYVFDTLVTLNAWLLDEANKAKLKVGDNLYIKALNTPDYWWDGEQKQPLETQKVDLTEYAKTTYVDNEVSSVQTDLNNYKSTNDSAVKSNSDAISVLNGNSITKGSVDYKIKNAISNENLSQYATDSELKGVSDRVKAIEDDYALDSDLSELSTQVGAIDERVTALEESGSSTPSGEPLVVYLSISSSRPTLTTQGKIVGATMVDWGDGSPLEDISQLSTYTHTYNNTSTSGTPYSARFYGAITEIGSYAFTDGMTQVVGVDIPNTITTLGNYAFSNCYFNTRVTLPPSVRSIGSRCFRGSLAGIIECLGRTPPTLQKGDGHFPSTANLIVPNKYLEAYKTDWSAYASQIDSYALVSELPENEDVSLPIASTDTLGGVKVGESLQINDNGVIDTKPLSYIYCSTADTSVNNIDGDGIQCTIYEIEVETQTEDGSVHYEYARDNEIGIPIVAGEGISIISNSNNKAEIGVDDIPTSKLFKDVNEIEIGHIDINNLYSSNAGIVYFSDVSFMDDNGGDLAKSTAYHRLPIVAGEGISIAENSDRTKAVISADGLATESYVDTKVANLVNSAPETLNTLGELATAIQNHEDEYDALLETVGNKANKSDVPTKTSQLTNDSGFLTSAPVTSVNGQTGAVTVPTYYVATSTSNGLMPSGDKKKVDYIKNTQLGVSIGENAYNAGHSDANDIMLGKNATQSGNNVACSNSAENSAIAIGHYANAYGTYGINIGTPRQSTNTSQFGAKAPSAIAIGTDALASNEGSIAVGDGAKSSANYAVQIGTGTNSTANTLQFRDYTLVNADGSVPTERLFKDVNYFDMSSTIDELDTDSGISLSTTTSYFNNGKKLAEVGGYSWLPIVPGSGVSFATNDSGKAEIGIDYNSQIVFNIFVGSYTDANMLCLQFTLPSTGFTADNITNFAFIASRLTKYSGLYVVYPATGAVKVSGTTYNINGVYATSSSNLNVVGTNHKATSTASPYISPSSAYKPTASNSSIYARWNGVDYTYEPS